MKDKIRKMKKWLLPLFLLLLLWGCGPQIEEKQVSNKGEKKSESQEQEKAQITEDGSYTSKEEVALYIHQFGRLPQNFISKKEAKSLGWDNSKGNLREVAPGKSIGGDFFGNYEEILPEGDYRECDINYRGGYRGAERIIYGEDGSIYYSKDHYKSFENLYQGDK